MSYGGRPPQRPQQRVSQRTYTIRRLTALGVVVVFIGGLWFGATAIFGSDDGGATSPGPPSTVKVVTDGVTPTDSWNPSAGSTELSDQQAFIKSQRAAAATAQTPVVGLHDRTSKTCSPSGRSV